MSVLHSTQKQIFLAEPKVLGHYMPFHYEAKMSNGFESRNKHVLCCLGNSIVLANQNNKEKEPIKYLMLAWK